MNYIVRNGETFSDVCLNATGDINQWEVILKANNFTDWVPDLYPGQSIYIPDSAITKASLKTILTKYPANNNADIGDLEIQIMTFINLMTVVKYQDFFLPSQAELQAMYSELWLHGVGGFNNNTYWTSSEQNFSSSWYQNFGSGIQSVQLKSYALFYTRACRAFTSVSPSYSLRDVGPAGGLIFWKSGNDYLEAAPSDQSISQSWSNIDNIAIGTTGIAIGTGQANTAAIIGQAGHTDSAAKLCNDLVIVR